ncbi:glycosyltransferase family 4 protein [Sphingomonas echinoides]|jgi:glycosyltransferase involved in cell wall biosynthesis|uniref:glycosyltransferase family 4 protein n=1 Tax=Sphingomonas echinoides TaxID=59803 RepID=UPI003EEB2E1F
MTIVQPAYEAAKPFQDRPMGSTRLPTHRSAIEIVLDLSRLLSRVLHPSPTGVDRVELAYARTLERLVPNQLRYAALHPSGVYGRLNGPSVERFLDQTERRWESVGHWETAATSRRFGLEQCWALRPGTVARTTGPRVLLQVSPHHLDRPSTVARKLQRERARFVCLVHDVIPITHPEYARPNGHGRHTRRLQTIDAFADGILANSQATLDSLIHGAGVGFRHRPSRIAHLGVEVSRPVRTPERNRAPYFVCVATIEPRKNHLLLLNIWRSIVEAIGPQQAPQLLLVGRRGWENENIIDMLERCPSLKGVVHEMPRLADAELRSVLHGARALLMPSFIEGFGLPIAEALAAGVPVLASDIPAHREAGGAIPEYIDPIDGAGWRTAILAYQAPANPRRFAQIERITRWQPVTWRQHVETALSLIEEVAAC